MALALLLAVVGALAVSAPTAGAAEPPQCGWVAVYYPEPEGGRLSWTVVAPLAHDAVGAAVPTSLSLSEGDVVTLTVHHRVGDPAAVGAPFVYPIFAGEGWEGGFHGIEIPIPVQESPEPSPSGAQPTCAVPGLKHDSLHRARAQLRAAGCALADVHHRSGVPARPGRVVKQAPPPGTEGDPRLPVTVTLDALPSR